MKNKVVSGDKTNVSYHRNSHGRCHMVTIFLIHRIIHRTRMYLTIVRYFCGKVQNFNQSKLEKNVTHLSETSHT